MTQLGRLVSSSAAKGVNHGTGRYMEKIRYEAVARKDLEWVTVTVNSRPHLIAVFVQFVVVK